MCSSDLLQIEGVSVFHDLKNISGFQCDGSIRIKSHGRQIDEVAGSKGGDDQTARHGGTVVDLERPAAAQKGDESSGVVSDFRLDSSAEMVVETAPPAMRNSVPPLWIKSSVLTLVFIDSVPPENTFVSIAWAPKVRDRVPPLTTVSSCDTPPERISLPAMVPNSLFASSSTVTVPPCSTLLNFASPPPFTPLLTI